MDYEILYPGAFPLLKVQLSKGRDVESRIRCHGIDG